MQIPAFLGTRARLPRAVTTNDIPPHILVNTRNKFHISAHLCIIPYNYLKNVKGQRIITASGQDEPKTRFWLLFQISN